MYLSLCFLLTSSLYVIKLNQLKATPFNLTSKYKCPHVLMNISHFSLSVLQNHIINAAEGDFYGGIFKAGKTSENPY